MMLKDFNNYGYSKDSYLECNDMICNLNRKNIFILNTWLLLINLVYLLSSALPLFGLKVEKLPLYLGYFIATLRSPFYLSYLIISIVFDVFLIFFPKVIEKYNHLL